MPASPEVIDAFEQDVRELDRLLDDARPEDWDTQTPAPGWSVRDQVAHLAFVFDLAASACARPEVFREAAAAAARDGFDAAVQASLVRWRRGTTADVLARFRQAASEVAEALRAVRTPTVPWLVTPLPPDVLTMAGMLETFAHGQDVADALGRPRVHSDTVALLVHFVARTRDFGYLGRGLTPPSEPFRFEVVLPSGRLVQVGPETSENVVRGPAVDLCLLAARRRHPDDLAVTATGEQARAWLPIAQAYRGPAGPGRRAGQFAGPTHPAVPQG